MARTLNLEKISTRRQRIGQKARDAPELVFTSLADNIDLVWLWEALHRTRKDGAVGVDGVDWRTYASNGQENLRALLDRFKSGSYRAPPTKRAYIPKADGRQRPIAITALEDKVLQRAVVMAMEDVYEQDFYDFSYGYRRGKSPHMALKAVVDSLNQTNGGWVLEIDVKGFFDAISHRKLREILDLRVRDGVIRRTIDKWLRAGVLENGVVTTAKSGTPQGGVASPLLANIYLHEVLDKWFVQEVQPRLRGWSRMFRFADDLVMSFQREEDAKRAKEAIVKRFARYELEVHPEKTKLVDFRHPFAKSANRESRKPGSFGFLGFTYYWTRPRGRRGRWFIARKTAKKKLKAAFGKMKVWMRKSRHLPLAEQAKTLGQKLRGHYAYYGIWGNTASLKDFFYHVVRMWRKWLSRRGQKPYVSWDEMVTILKHAKLPPPRMVHRNV